MKLVRPPGTPQSRSSSTTQATPSVPMPTCVAITGVTGGPLLPGVSFGTGYAETSSPVMSSRHGTVRHLTTQHRMGG